MLNDEEVGRHREDVARLPDAAQVADGQDREKREAHLDAIRIELWKRRRDREDAGGDADRDRQRVVHQQRRRRNQPGGRPDVLLRDDVGAAAGRVGVNRLPIGEGDDRQQRRDDEADRHRVDERAHARDDERGQDEVGRVGDRRQRVGRQHGQAR